MSSIKVIALVTVKPEYTEVLAAQFKGLVKANRTEAGNISYDLHQEVGNPDHFVFVGNWKSQATTDEHNTSEHFQGSTRAIDDKTDGLEIVLMNEFSVWLTSDLFSTKGRTIQVYYDRDASLSLIKSKTIAIIGHGSQGHTHTANLKNPDVKIVVGPRQGGSWKKAETAGFRVLPVADTTKKVNMVMILLPDENQPVVYKNEVEPSLKQGVILAFAHGFNVHYNQTVSRTDLDAIMVTPRGLEYTVRSEFSKGGGAPSPIAVHQDKSGKARDIILSCATANGGIRGGVIEADFREEIRTGLFDEQTMLCGGVIESVKTGFRTLTEASCAPEIAYFKYLHEMKLTAGLTYGGDTANMNCSIPGNAEYGGYAASVEVISDKSREVMRNALKRIQTGEYAKMSIRRGAVNYISMTVRHYLTVDHQIERVSARLRFMMPWIAKNKLVDLDKNRFWIKPT